MKKNIYFKKIIFVLFMFFAIPVFAANPAQPFLPSDNIIDPGCTPLDSNCYVIMPTSFTDETVTGLDYSTSTGILSLTSGFMIPTTASTTEWDNKVSSQWVNDINDISYSLGDVEITNDLTAGNLYSIGSIYGGNGNWSIDSVGYFSGVAAGANASANGQPLAVFDSNNYVIDTNGNYLTAYYAQFGAYSGLALAVNNSGYVYDDNGSALASVYADSAFIAGSAQYGINTGNVLAVNDGSGYVVDDNGSYLNATYADSADIANSASIANIAYLSGANLGSFFTGNGFALNAENNPISGLALGSASLPSFSFFNDSNTGIWSPTADVLAISTGGGERLRVLASGNVGIGTTAPAQLLHVRGTNGRIRIDSSPGGNPVLEMTDASGTSFLFTSAQNWFMRTDSTSKHVFLQSGSPNSQGYVAIGNGSFNSAPVPTSQLTVRGNLNSSTFGLLDVQSYAGTSRLFVRDDGNVGIGTTTPANKLHIAETTNAGAALLQSANTNVDLLLLQSTVSNGYASIGFRNSAGTATGGFGYGNTSAANFADKVYFYSSGTRDMGFSTNGGAADLLTLKGANGNVGIGTTTPAARFVVNGTASNNQIGVGINNTDATGYSVLRVGSTGAALPFGVGLHQFNSSWVGSGALSPSMAALIAYESGGLSIGTNNASASLRFYTGGSSAANERITILNNGNVGIGTTTPSQRLSVAGNAQFTSVGSGAYAFDLNLTSDGTLTTSASDERLKQNIVTLSASSTLEKINMLRPVSFDWKSNNAQDLGLIAQEVENVFPELVFTNNTDGFKGINYSRVSTLLISAIQELTKKINSFFDGTAKLKVKELCIEDVCVTKDQLKNLLQNQNNNTNTPTYTTVIEEVTSSTSSSTEVIPENIVEDIVSNTETENTNESTPTVEEVITTTESSTVTE